MREAGRHLWDLRTPMHDGTELSTDLHLPAGGLAGGPYPLVVVRTPEDNQRPRLVALAKVLSERGLAVALQDVRGRQDSDGTFEPFVHEGRDGFDSVEWFAAQPWCTGAVALAGSGYSAWAAWAAAREQPPHLAALAVSSTWSPVPAEGPAELRMLAWLHATSARVWQEAGPVEWERVLRDPSVRTMDRLLGRSLPRWRDWLDGTWAGLEVGDPVDLPVLHLTGWYDSAQRPSLLAWERQRGIADQTLVIGPWDHASTTAAADVEIVPWLVHRLLGHGEAPASRWAVGGGWTPGEHEVALPLDAGSWRHDPADPVVLTPDLTFFPSPPAQPTPVPLDRRFVERRPDVLVWTSGAAELEIVGRPRIELEVETDADDTDWWVQLTDVAPGGASTVLADGMARAGSGPLVVELGAVGHVVLAGHRLRVSVASSCFPLRAVHPVAATNRVLAGSRLVLPTTEVTGG